MPGGLPSESRSFKAIVAVPLCLSTSAGIIFTLLRCLRHIATKVTRMIITNATIAPSVPPTMTAFDFGARTWWSETGGNNDSVAAVTPNQRGDFSVRSLVTY